VRSGPPERLLVGFHGYAEDAEAHLTQMLQIRGVDSWTVVAVQALHPFYALRRVVASWMTSQDRELAIADNKAYVRSVVATFPPPRALVFEGFSQGTAMAYRAASDHPRAAGVIALSGDVPPEVTSALPPVLLGRGGSDDWYTQEKFEKDLKFLNTITSVRSLLFDGGHEWTDDFRETAGEFLSVILSEAKNLRTRT
jgi:predicted esterase